MLVKPVTPVQSREPLDTREAFERLFHREFGYVMEWLARLHVQPGERQDLAQDIFLAAYRRRDSYDPALATHVAWLYGFITRYVFHHRRQFARQASQLAATNDVVDAVDSSSSPEDQVAARTILEGISGGIDDDHLEIVVAHEVHGTPMEVIAKEHGLTLATAYSRYRKTRAKLQEAYERSERGLRWRHRGVFPFLILSNDDNSSTLKSMQGDVWESIRSAIEASPASAPLTGTSLGATALAAPYVLPLVTSFIGAVAGAALTYTLMRSDGTAAQRIDAEARVAAVTPSAPAEPVAPASSPTVAAPAPSTSPAPGAPGNVERSGQQAPRPDPGGNRSADVAAEQALFDRATSAFETGRTAEALKSFAEHARRFPKGRHAAMREKLWTLALINAGHVGEARQRIEQLRRANPKSPLLIEFEKALPPSK